jgi:hypothetical protein
MGEVFRAYDTGRERVVALKRLPAALAADTTFQARFRAEAALAARLAEPHVIPIHDFGDVDGQLYIDMRLVEGPDLATLLGRDGPLDPARAVDVVVQVAAALDAAHAAGLVHRDIKPGNILVTDQTPDGAGEVATRAADFVYVADFGIARATDSGNSGSLTATGTTVGSLDYIAPERFGTDRGDRRVDVYSLGCVLFEALTGQRPFPVEGLPAIINAHLNTAPPAPSALRPDVPIGLDAVVRRAMAKDPGERYATAGALAAAARAALAGHAVPGGAAETVAVVSSGAGGVPPAPPGRPDGTGGGGARRRRHLVALAAAATVAVLVAAVVTSQLVGGGARDGAGHGNVRRSDEAGDVTSSRMSISVVHEGSCRFVASLPDGFGANRAGRPPAPEPRSAMRIVRAAPPRFSSRAVGQEWLSLRTRSSSPACRIIPASAPSTPAGSRNTLRVAVVCLDHLHALGEGGGHVSAPQGSEGPGEDPVATRKWFELVGPADEGATAVGVEVPFTADAGGEAGKDVREPRQLVGEARPFCVFGQLFVGL